MDAPWPPVYPKQPNEPPRVAPSRAKKDRGPGRETSSSDCIRARTIPEPDT